MLLVSRYTRVGFRLEEVMRRILGYAVLSLPFVAIFTLTILVEGWMVGVGIMGGMAFIVATSLIGLRLIDG